MVTPTSASSYFPHVYYTADTIALLHRLEGLVDPIQSLSVCDELVYLQFARHVVVNQIG